MNITIILYVISSLVFYFFFRRTEKKVDRVNGWVIMRGETP